MMKTSSTTTTTTTATATATATTATTATTTTATATTTTTAKCRQIHHTWIPLVKHEEYLKSQDFTTTNSQNRLST